MLNNRINYVSNTHRCFRFPCTSAIKSRNYLSLFLTKLAPRLPQLILSLLLVVMMSGCGAIKNNVRSWNKADTAYQATYLAITAVDMAQTHWMAKQDWKWDGREYIEFNPLFFNKKPHQDAADIMIPLAMIAHTGIALALPPEYKVFGFEINPRRIWQMIWILTEAGAVGNNMGAGVRIEF
ncbi:MAG: hypothetical protein PHS93_09005 [Candidatus Omnitrophica bacterium]|nr:hypothetical protein [Candidatus Omnitrophota bacterium]MDD5353283.1 hypothetical protein [Candidatus Omnitrophota bacterium]